MLKVVIGVLLIVALLVVGVVWYLSRSTTASGKPIVGDGSIFTPKPGSPEPAGGQVRLGDYLRGLLGQTGK